MTGGTSAVQVDMYAKTAIIKNSTIRNCGQGSFNMECGCIQIQKDVHYIDINEIKQEKDQDDDVKWCN